MHPTPTPLADPFPVDQASFDGSTPLLDSPIDQATLDESTPLADSSVDRQANADESFFDFQYRFYQLERERRAQAITAQGSHGMLGLEYEAILREVEQTRSFAQLAAERRDRLKFENDELREKLALSQAVRTALAEELERHQSKEKEARRKEEENARLKAENATLDEKARIEVLQAFVTGLEKVLDKMEARDMATARLPQSEGRPEI